MSKFSLKIIAGVLCCFLVYCSNIVFAGSSEEILFGQVEYSYITPHIKWAKPYSKGRLKILVIAPNLTHRESVELYQRFDVEVLPVSTASYNEFTIPKDKSYGPGYIEEEKVKELAENAVLSNWQVVIIGKFDWNVLPSSIQLLLLNNVKEQGAGLVLIDQKNLPDELKKIFSSNSVEDSNSYFQQVIPWSELPVFNPLIPDKPFLRMAKFGKGRIIALNYYQDRHGVMFSSPASRQCLTPDATRSMNPYPDDILSYDYYMSLVIRSIVWAGNLEGNVRIKNIRSENTSFLQQKIEFDRAKLSETLFIPWLSEPRLDHHSWLREKAKIRFNLEGAVGAKTNVFWIIRNQWNEEEAKGTVENLKPGENTIEMPVISGGKHFFDLWVRDIDNKIIDWKSVVINVKSEINISEIILDKLSFERNEEVKGKIILNNELTDRTKLFVEILDNDNHLFVRKQMKSSEAVCSFSIKVPGLQVLSYFAKAIIEDERGIVSSHRTEFFIPKRGNDDYQFAIWQEGKDEPVNNYVLERLKELGVDIISPGLQWTTPYDLFSQARNVARHNLRILPYFESFCGYGLSPGRRDAEDKPLCPEPCFNDKDKWNNYPFGGLFSRIKERNKIMSSFGAVGYMFSEEDWLDLNKTDRCFCTFCIKSFQKYLKESYKEISQLNKTWGTNYTDWLECTPITFAEAEKTGEFPRWVDHRRHMELSWTNFHLEMTSASLEADQYTDPLFFGNNLEPYFGIDPSRLYLNAGSVYTAFPFRIEYDGNGDGWEAVSFAKQESYISPCTGVYVAPGIQMEDNMRCYPWWNIAMGCNGTVWFVGDGDMGQGGAQIFTSSLERTVKYFSWMMEEVREIKSGIGRLLLESKRADDGVRILYSSPSMLVSEFSRKETNWVVSRNSFHAILADTGIGYKHISSTQLLKEKLEYPDIKVLILPFSQAISKAEADAILNFAKSGGLIIADFNPGIMDEHGKKLDKSYLSELFPAFEKLNKNNFGKGKSIYLGNLINGYNNKRYSYLGSKMLKSFIDIIKENAGIGTKCSVKSSDGKEVSGMTKAIFDDGDLTYIMLINETPESEKVIVRYNKNCEIYDVRDKKYLGKDEIEVEVVDIKPKVLAFVPYRVEKLELKIMKQEQYTVTFNAKLKTSTGKSGKHVFRLNVYGDDKKEIPYYTRNIVTINGNFEGIVNFALNEAPGKYTLELTDIGSGVSSKLDVSISIIGI